MTDRMPHESRLKVISLLLALVVCGAVAMAEQGPVLSSLNGMSSSNQQATYMSGNEAASDMAGQGWLTLGATPVNMGDSSSGMNTGTPIPVEVSALNRSTRSPSRYSEPSLSVTPDGNPKKAKTNWMLLGGAAIAGALLGYFLLPFLFAIITPWVGALLGAAVMGGAAWFMTRSKSKKN